MPLGRNRSLSHGRTLGIAILAVFMLFITCVGVGLGNGAVVGLAMASGVFGVATVVITAGRGGDRVWVLSSAYVVRSSEPPSVGTFGRCELQLIVTTPDGSAKAVKVRDSGVPIAKWPAAGGTLPVEVASDDPRRVQVLWEDVRTHGDVAAEEDLLRLYDHPLGHLSDPRDSHLGPFLDDMLSPDAPAASGLVTPLAERTPRPPRRPSPRPRSAPDDEIGPSDPLPPLNFLLAPDDQTPDSPIDQSGPIPDLIPDFLIDSTEPTSDVAPSNSVPPDVVPPHPVASDQVLSDPVASDQVAQEPVAQEPPGEARLTEDPAATDPAAAPPAYAGLAHPSPNQGLGVTLIVSDLDRSLSFYRDLLGFTVVDGGVGNAVLAFGESRVVLRRVTNMPPVDRRLIHLNIEVPDVHAAYEDLRAQGVTFVHRPRVVSRTEQLELWAAPCHDPDGHGIGLTHWEPRP